MCGLPAPCGQEEATPFRGSRRAGLHLVLSCINNCSSVVTGFTLFILLTSGLCPPPSGGGENEVRLFCLLNNANFPRYCPRLRFPYWEIFISNTIAIRFLLIKKLKIRKGKKGMKEGKKKKKK